jgi:hypothetical protein
MARVNTYDIRTPRGAGEGYRVERVPPPSLGGVCFQNMHSAADLQSVCAQAPEGHTLITNRIRAMGKARAESSQPLPPRITVKAERQTFTRGSTVKDLKTGRRGIIIKANASYTAKSHSPVHRICDENGDTWLAKEKHLKLKH